MTPGRGRDRKPDNRREGHGLYAKLNGVNLYYESHGTGGAADPASRGLGSGEMFGPILPALSQRHQVIVVDFQGLGRTADIDRSIDIRLMTDDIAALIDHLGLNEHQFDHPRYVNHLPDDPGLPLC
jgi:pimeloyl-ACP methyl ester carboxylesterase